MGHACEYDINKGTSSVLTSTRQKVASKPEKSPISTKTLWCLALAIKADEGETKAKEAAVDAGENFLSLAISIARGVAPNHCWGTVTEDGSLMRETGYSPFAAILSQWVCSRQWEREHWLGIAYHHSQWVPYKLPRLSTVETSLTVQNGVCRSHGILMRHMLLACSDSGEEVSKLIFL